MTPNPNPKSNPYPNTNPNPNPNPHPHPNQARHDLVASKEAAATAQRLALEKQRAQLTGSLEEI